MEPAYRAEAKGSQRAAVLELSQAPAFLLCTSFPSPGFSLSRHVQ